MVLDIDHADPQQFQPMPHGGQLGAVDLLVGIDLQPRDEGRPVRQIVETEHVSVPVPNKLALRVSPTSPK